ncbi:MAG: prephenate dehydratase [Ferrimicrobium sp.]
MGDAKGMVCIAGPLGSSDHRAIDLFGLDEIDALPMPSLDDVIHTVGHTPGIFGILPIENSIEGELTLTLDRLIFDSARVHIVAEAVLGEEMWAFTLGGTASIHTVVSHSMILDLCASYIRQNGLRVIHAVSTASACEQVVRGGDPGVAALAPPQVGESAGLRVFDAHVSEVGELRTRFALIAQTVPPSTGDDRTMIVITPRSDSVGALAEIAGVFEQHRVNMFSILSRPMAVHNGLHCFVVGAEGHVDEPPLSNLIVALIHERHSLKLLGSYPRWRGQQVVTPSPSLPAGALEVDELLSGRGRS